MLSRPREILVVEDHADSAAAMDRYLRSCGHRIHVADSCEAARRIFEANEKIDLLLMDFGLPDGDGCDLLRDLCAIRNVPAIAITGFGQLQDVERSATAGFAAHLTKPIGLDQLDRVIAGISPPALFDRGGPPVSDGKSGI